MIPDITMGIILALAIITISQLAKIWTNKNFPTKSPFFPLSDIIGLFSIFQWLAAICLGALLTILLLAS